MAKVERFYIERREGFQNEARALEETLQHDLGLGGLEAVRLWVRYDIQGVEGGVPDAVRYGILSEPRTDVLFEETLPSDVKGQLFAVEALPGQYDQRADSCAQCIELLCKMRPVVRVAMVYAFEGDLSEEAMEAIADYLVNPVEARRAKLAKPESLDEVLPPVEAVPVYEGFIGMDETALAAFHGSLGLAMDLDDLRFLQAYFKEEDRDPTETELRVIDTYWSDHCRHTTFNTHIDEVTIDDARVRAGFEVYQEIRKAVYPDTHQDRPMSLMDMGTIATKYLKKSGQVRHLDESEEINACSVKTTVQTADGPEPWLYMFKNETHNHPTEIEPFGGAATCLGGAIRDPLSGRSYVYQGMRVSGAADPRRPLEDTLPGKLPQRRICTLAADGFSSYGNQIGLAAGLIDEIYHPGYEAKRMEVGAVIAAAPEANVRRFVPEAGDVVVLIGGRTGRDGLGGATGSSKVHTEDSLETSGAEVQKGNPVEERKIQRLFRRPEVAQAIRRCNDFGAGGVSVAIGELADGLFIHLDLVPKKYEGLNGTELAISESQERMACVINPADWEAFRAACDEENLEATIVAEVTEEKRLIMEWRGDRIVDIDRQFLDSAGAAKHAKVAVATPSEAPARKEAGPLLQSLLDAAKDLNSCSKRGMVERFDATIGAGTVLMPFGGRYQRTPIQTMAAKLPVFSGETSTTSLFSYGFDPKASAADPFMGAYDAVVESVTRLMAAGTCGRDVYLSLQEYFPSLREEPLRWGQPFQAVLGALLAQLDLKAPAIGGKDSMSGSFEQMDVPPTLISFATTLTDAGRVLSPEFKGEGHPVLYYSLPRRDDGRLDVDALDAFWTRLESLVESGLVLSAWAVSRGGGLEGLVKMSLGNGIGVALNEKATILSELGIGSFLFECVEPFAEGTVIGETLAGAFTYEGETLETSRLLQAWEGVLEEVYPTAMPTTSEAPTLPEKPGHLHKASTSFAKPRVVIPVFPGTNCEYDTKRSFEAVGAVAETVVIANRTPAHLEASLLRLEAALREAQILALPGGFSFGDEPDGSGKFITAFLRERRMVEAIDRLLTAQDGLILGICNGFQALVKLGLLPYGQIIDPKDNDCTLTHNLIGRHQSRYVRTRLVSTASPWLSAMQPGDEHWIPISHGEGRFVASPDTLERLRANGQIATQYVDSEGHPSMDIEYNPNGSTWAIEGLLSVDGRIFGKMGHSERVGAHIAKNIPGNKIQPIFAGGVQYFK